MFANAYKFYNGWYNINNDEITRKKILDTACRFHGSKYVVKKIKSQMCLNYITIQDLQYISNQYMYKFPKKIGFRVYH